MSDNAHLSVHSHFGQAGGGASFSVLDLLRAGQFSAADWKKSREYVVDDYKYNNTVAHLFIDQLAHDYRDAVINSRTNSGIDSRSRFSQGLQIIREAFGAEGFVDLLASPYSGRDVRPSHSLLSHLIDPIYCGSSGMLTSICDILKDRPEQLLRLMTEGQKICADPRFKTSAGMSTLLECNGAGQEEYLEIVRDALGNERFAVAALSIVPGGDVFAKILQNGMAGRTPDRPLGQGRENTAPTLTPDGQ